MNRSSANTLQMSSLCTHDSGGSTEERMGTWEIIKQHPGVFRIPYALTSDKIEGLRAYLADCSGQVRTNQKIQQSSGKRRREPLNKIRILWAR